MKIKQFKDTPLAHYSYALISKGEMAVIDPARDPRQYYRFAEENNARITAVLETHPHADFVSGHLQIHRETGATVYSSEMAGVSYPHKPLKEGEEITIGEVTISARHTPGHSPDSFTFIAGGGAGTALFTGDTIFIGDVGRPDLREKVGNLQSKREELAAAMYETVHNKFTDLPDEAIIYPAHGAGSLCGKNMSDASYSTLGRERKTNWAFQEQPKEAFIREILKDQPFIPSYFGFNVDLNRKGAENMQQSVYGIPLRLSVEALGDEIVVVDVRDEESYKKGHLPNSINIMAEKEAQKFETWLGAILDPEEPFYLVVASIDDLPKVLERVAKIGYEQNVKAVVTLREKVSRTSDRLDLREFRENRENYTIVDVRNESELREGKLFENAKAIPLHELRKRAEELPAVKPFVVHCAGGYRSAAGSSILENRFANTKVFDLGDAVTEFK